MRLSFDPIKDLVDAVIYWRIAALFVVMLAVLLGLVFMFNQNVARTVMLLGNSFLLLALLTVLSSGKLAGATMLTIIGITIIVLSGESWF